MNRFFKITHMAHFLLSQVLKEGNVVVDATAGNGYDTLFLAKLVGVTGKVYAFDVQESALEKTKVLLTQHDCLKQVVLIHDSHEHLDRYIAEPIQGVTYNLGYLPGGDKKIITKGESTLLSLKQATKMLLPQGMITVITYSGHPGGKEESTLIEGYLSQLISPPWTVFSWKKENRSGESPQLFILSKEETF